MGLSAEFRERSVIEAFVNLDDKGKFKQIPNGDYHTNVLVSDALLRSVDAKLYGGAKFKDFHYEDISDENVISRFSLKMETRFVGYIKVHRNSAGREPGLFVDLLSIL